MFAPAGASGSDASTDIQHDPPCTSNALGNLTPPDRALAALGQELLRQGYRFTTVTPASHERVHRRAAQQSLTLRDIFGWSRPFAEADLSPRLLLLLGEAGVLERAGDQLRSTVRFSTLGEQIFVHSAFPTEQGDAVFFGPDTYRFARSLRHWISGFHPRPRARVLDIGAGSGAGGLHVAALLRGGSPRVVLTDINQGAIRFSRINAALNGIADVEVVESDLYANVQGSYDLIISNPPYLVDPLARLYRHGGGDLGFALSVKIAEQGVDRLAPGGHLLLYTGSAIVDGIDALHDTLRDRLGRRAVDFHYEEVDPDVFGEELEHPPYDKADRIAAVVATIAAR
jgi:methylase of polypeptide subunit release factors